MATTVTIEMGPVFYVTTDLMVNGPRAWDLGCAHGFRVEVVFPRDLPLPPGAAALIFDRDHLWLTGRERDEWLAELTANPPSQPTFVHSYEFDDDVTVTAGGVILSRRLDDLPLANLAGPASPASMPAA